MRRSVLLVASVALAVLLASGTALAQTADTTPPETTIGTWDRPSAHENETNASFGFASDDTGATFECKFDAGAYEPCTSPKSYYSLTETVHTFEVRAKDAAGNVDATPATYTWEVDITPPAVTWTERPGIQDDYSSGDWFTTDNTPTWAYSFSDKNLMEGDPQCELYSATLEKSIITSQPCPSPTTFPFELADGEYYFSVWQDDKAYNERYVTQYLTIDTAAPAAPTITSPANNSSDADGSIAFGGTTEPYATVEIYEGATLKGTARAYWDGQWEKTIAGVANGSHTYTAKAIDRAGNASATSSSAVTVTVGTTSTTPSNPKVSGTSPLGGATGVLPGANVTATFSEAMMASTINRTNVKLVKKGTTTVIGATVAYDSVAKKATLNPNANLVRGAYYTATVTTATKDLAGYRLDQNPNLTGLQPKTWTFRVRT